MPGSKWNPIVVEDEDELGTFHNPIEIKEEVGREEETKCCERCGQTGHRECHGFTNPCGSQSQVGMGAGRGWQITTPEKPAPVARV
jgi:hypothetical protein